MCIISWAGVTTILNNFPCLLQAKTLRLLASAYLDRNEQGCLDKAHSAVVLANTVTIFVLYLVFDWFTWIIYGYMKSIMFVWSARHPSSWPAVQLSCMAKTSASSIFFDICCMWVHHWPPPFCAISSSGDFGSGSQGQLKAKFIVFIFLWTFQRIMMRFYVLK